ncbi:MAG TPA: hypothetical protein VN776_15185 [Terracidiphilus sp.]|nr:hypothetical protein [Terracidiphilus sp.]
MFRPAEYGIAAAIEAAGSAAAGPATAAALESTAFVSSVDGFRVSSAQRLNADTRKAANIPVANFLELNLIVASRTARRDHRNSQRRVNLTQTVQIGHTIA